jgi:hypothetical protein
MQEQEDRAATKRFLCKDGQEIVNENGGASGCFGTSSANQR